jgi:glycosyltransferase involved in cell wall biosynthesis
MYDYLPHYLEPKKSTIRILFAYKNFAARKGISHIGLGVSHLNTSTVLKKLGVWAEVRGITSHIDLNKLLNEIDEQALKREEVRISHCILAAPWLEIEDLERIMSIHNQMRFCVVCHSNAAFLSADTGAIKRLPKLVDLQLHNSQFRVACNSEKGKKWVEAAYRHSVLCLPNLYDTDTFVGSPNIWRGGILRIGCFGAMRPLKNMFSAAVAAIIIAEKLRADVEFHLTSGREGSQYTINCIQELLTDHKRVKLVVNAWSVWSEFRNLVSTMHLMFQPSFTESFNIVSADGVAEGVPSVVGEAIDWCPIHWIAPADDANHMATTGMHLLSDYNSVQEGREALKRYVENGKHSWMEYLLGK